MPGDEPELLYRFAVVPRFAPSPAWSDRLVQNGGVEIDGATGRPRPRDDWTPVDDVASLVDELPARDAILPSTHLGLIDIPARLRRAWWAQAERAGTPPGTGFDKIFADVVEFLRFKRVPLPGRVSLEVMASAPGMSSTSPAGLGLGTSARQTLGLVNVGDEASFVVLLDLPPRTLAARLRAAGQDAADELSPHELVDRYLRTFPHQRCLRVRLAPGEGLWLSPLGVVHDGYTRGKRDLDLMLSVGRDPPGRVG
jgi:hypothetical protein